MTTNPYSKGLDDVAKSIWHEPGEKPDLEATIVFLCTSPIPHTIKSHYRPNMAWNPNIPWCYEEDLARMLNDMRKAEKEPKAKPEPVKLEWHSITGIEFDKDLTPKVMTKKCTLEETDQGLKYSEAETVNEPKPPPDPNLPNMDYMPPLPSKLAHFTHYDKLMGLVNNQAPDHVVSPQAETAKPAAGSVEQTLEDRKKTHGDFRNHSAVTQAIKHAMRCRSSWNHLSDAQQEALDMIAHKIGRVLAGDPNHDDHWHDIAGYAMLVERQIKEKAKAAKTAG